MANSGGSANSPPAKTGSVDTVSHSLRDLPITTDNYEVLDQIGDGAYGTVFRGRDRYNEDRFVALKKVRITLNDDGVPGNVVREISILKQLEKFEHPNIVKLLDISHGRIVEREQRLNLFLVFEYIERDLNTYLKKCPSPGLEPARIKCLIHQILCGVDFLHSHRIIHRDLKPQNLLIDRQDRVKITDFGLARIYDFNMRLTTMVVTLWYRAPEVLLSNSYATPVDIWSCGCIFAELFRRRPLFQGNTEGDQLQKIFDIIGTPPESEWPKDVSLSRSNFRTHNGRPLQDVIPEITPEAVDLLQKMLKFNPSLRYSASEALTHSYFRGMSQPKCIATSNRSSPIQAVLSGPNHHSTSVPVSTSTSPAQDLANDENNRNAVNSPTRVVVQRADEPKVNELSSEVPNSVAMDTSSPEKSVQLQSSMPGSSNA